MAHSVRYVVRRHIRVVVCFNRVCRIYSCHVRIGQKFRHGDRLRFREPASEIGILFTECCHGQPRPIPDIRVTLHEPVFVPGDLGAESIDIFRKHPADCLKFICRITALSDSIGLRERRPIKVHILITLEQEKDHRGEHNGKEQLVFTVDLPVSEAYDVATDHTNDQYDCQYDQKIDQELDHGKTE